VRKIGLHVGLVCRIAGVSRSGYYKWLKHADEPDKDHASYLQINEIFRRGKAKYGWRTIQMKLLETGVVMNHKKILRIKDKYHLITNIRRRNPYKMIMKKSLEHRTCENRLNRAFTVSAPFKMFSTDITYLPLNYRFAYLSVVKDLASGEVVAWNLSMHLEMSLVLDTVEAMKNNPVLTTATLQNALIHSDQGFHYTNPLYIEKIKALNMVQSMSRRGNCIDNAPIESFFGHLKDDVDYKDCKTFDELHSRIATYMQYYNHERQQWDLKKMTPVGYRNHLLTTA
jgi:transposase InsO family protein